jgi:hypothetical protein
MLLPSDLTTVDARLITELCEQSCPESQTLDFKRDLPGKDAKGRSELAKDVCAFANAKGGDLVFGILEKDGCAFRPAPITGETADAAMRRIRQTIEARVEPRLPGLDLQPVLLEGGYVLICRVPPSLSGPHGFEEDGGWRFVVRSTTHTADMKYEQLRQSFDRGSSLIEKMEQFRAQRIANILSGTIWRPVVGGPICVVHLVPLEAVTETASVDVRALKRDYMRLMFPDWGGAAPSLNLDGLVVHHGGRVGESAAHVQVFRSGAFEAVRTGGAIRADEKIMPSLTLSSFYRDAINKFIHEARLLGIGGAAAASIALLRVTDYSFVYSGPYNFPEKAIADRDNLILSPTWIERVETDPTEPVIQYQLDMLWQSFGLERCHYYDENGNWQPR